MKRCSKLNRAISVIVSFSIMVSAVFVFRFPFFGTARAASPDEHIDHKVCEGADACPNCEHEAAEWTEWTKTDALPDTAGHFYLADNVEIKEEWASQSGTFLCLNGKTITQTKPDKRVISIESTNEFTLSDCKGGGKVTGGSGKSGAGIYIHNNGTFTMFGGIISGNNADSADPEEGGGIYNDGFLTIYGGAVSDNSADIGGGIFNGSSNSFIMYGGTISNNRAVSGAGIYNNSGLEAYGGKILDNTASEYGGGIFNNDALELHGLTVSGNKAKRGGGAYNAEGGYADLVLYGGEFRNNIAEEHGGGIYTGSDITVSGGKVTKNTVDGSADNIYLLLNTSITVDGELSEDVVFGITTEDKPADNAFVYVTEVNDDDLSAHFFSDDPRYKTVDHILEQEHYITLVKAPVPPHIHDVCGGAEICPDSEHTGEHLNVEWQAWTETGSLPDSGGYYYLTENVTLDGAWEIPDDITLCLNGKTITQRAEGERVIRISSEHSLSLCDCEGKGLITGEDGVIYNLGTFNLYSGVLSGGFAADNGGGVLNEGKAEMFMYGGNISGCSAAENGGGVYIDADCTFTMCGGTISGNLAQTGGGVADNGTFIVYGGKVVENTAGGSASNVYLAKNKTITVGGTPTAGSCFGITTEIKPADGAAVAVTGENAGDFSRYFFSDSPKYNTVNERDNDKHTVKLVHSSEPSEKHIHPVCGDSSCEEHSTPVWQKWSATDTLPTASGYYFLAENVRLTEEWRPSGNIYLCFNGKTITQTVTDKRAVINSNGTLTLCDCGKDGGIVGGKAGGILNEGTLEMFGGVISGCTAENGGGILNYNYFIMDGGSIIKNEALNGGGIYNAEGANFEMRGGSIKGNRAELGGGVFQNGRMTLNGSPVVKGNGSNVYLPENKMITLSENLTSDAEVGVSTEVVPVDKAPVQITGSNTSDHSGKLFSDNGNYRIRLGEGLALMLTTSAAPDDNDPDNNTPGGNRPDDNPPGSNKPDDTPGSNKPDDNTGGNKPGSDTPVIDSDLYLDIRPVAPSEIPESDRAVAEKYIGTLNGWKFGQYYKIDLYRKTENSDEKLTYTDVPVYITAAIPEELLAEGREYALVRIYDGVPKLLCDTDSSAETITVVTDRFPTYALLYRDKTTDIGSDSNGNNGGGSTSNPNTGTEDIPLSIPAFASAALMLALPAKHRDGNIRP